MRKHAMPSFSVHHEQRDFFIPDKRVAFLPLLPHLFGQRASTTLSFPAFDNYQSEELQRESQRGGARHVTTDNLQRMIKLAEEFFETKNDPEQISVTEEIMNRLHELHPGTMSEVKNENGPIAWVLVIPTTHQLMEEFVSGAINEKELLDRTPYGIRYEALYLCSALVLPEERGKGLAKDLIIEAVRSIQKQHPIKTLFYWSFSPEGKRLASSVAKEIGLPLRERSSN